MNVIVVHEGLGVGPLGILVASKHEGEDDAGTGHEHDGESRRTRWKRFPGVKPGIAGRHLALDAQILSCRVETVEGTSEANGVVMLDEIDRVSGKRSHSREILFTGNAHHEFLVYAVGPVQGFR